MASKRVRAFDPPVVDCRSLTERSSQLDKLRQVGNPVPESRLGLIWM